MINIFKQLTAEQVKGRYRLHKHALADQFDSPRPAKNVGIFYGPKYRKKWVVCQADGKIIQLTE